MPRSASLTISAALLLGVCVAAGSCAGDPRPDRAEAGPGSPLPGSHVRLSAVPEPAIDWEPEIYVARKVAPGLRIDGVLDDPGWESADWTADFVDIQGEALPAPRLPPATGGA